MPTNRKDSAHVQARIMSEAAKGIQVPSHIRLRDRDIPFWKNIISARSEWTDVDLEEAANLARCRSDIEMEQMMLDVEGSVLQTDKGPKMNPRHSVLEQLSRRSVCLSRKLQVHAQATVGESKNQRGKNKVKRNAVNTLKQMEDDELINRPN